MSLFELYFQLGLQHIADLKAYDHILFIMTICALYRLKEWKKVLILITAFTLGHSLTLVLSTLGMQLLPVPVVECLIPLTIILAGLINLLYRTGVKPRTLDAWKYGTTLFFGLIHGLGFSAYLLSLLGKGERIFLPLLSFNLGVEVGQIIIVLCFLLLGEIFHRLFRVKHLWWLTVVTIVSFLLAILMLLQRIPW